MTITQGKKNGGERADCPANHIGVSHRLMQAEVLPAAADVEVRRTCNKHDGSAHGVYKYIGKVRLVVTNRRKVEDRQSDKPPCNAARDYSEQE